MQDTYGAALDRYHDEQLAEAMVCEPTVAQDFYNPWTGEWETERIGIVTGLVHYEREGAER